MEKEGVFEFRKYWLIYVLLGLGFIMLFSVITGFAIEQGVIFSCDADIVCGEWEQCKLSYGVDTLSSKGFQEIKERKCYDNNGCYKNFTMIANCSNVENIEFKASECGRDKTDLIDDSGKVVARINKITGDVVLNFDGELAC